MAEVQSRPSARGGRGSGRAGRGGHSARGGGRSRHTNGDAAAAIDHADYEVSLDDQGELGKLKKQYLTEIVTLKELFPDWTDDDFVFALQDADGDLGTVIERITDGQISQFSDVKKKNREKSKPKASDVAAGSTDKPFGSARGRGRGGSDSVRGGRGRGSDRGGRGGARGGRGGASRGAASSAAAAATATDSGLADTSTSTPSGWDTAPATTGTDAWADSSATPAAALEPAGDKPATTGAWGATTEKAVNAAADHTTTPLPSEQKSSLIPEGTKKTWASMLAQPKVQPVLPKAPPASAPINQTAREADTTFEHSPSHAIEVEPATTSAALHQSTPDVPDTAPIDVSLAPASVDLTPPRDELTEENLEHLPDTSRPAETETVISTRDPRSTVASTVGVSTPQQAAAQQPIGRPAPIGGYAASALKATHPGGRTPSYNRRLLDQTEAVVLPKDHAVERTTVQFGSMGLGSDKPSDVDDQPEEPETRGQLPQQSPVQPRASLPPAIQQAPVAQEPVRDTAATPKAAPGLPPAPQHSIGLGQPPYGQYGRYGGPGALGQEQAAAQKPYDAFGQQLNYPQGQSEGIYPGHQQQSSVASQAAGHHSNTSLNQSDYAAQYGEHQRGAYQGFYGGYNQQHGGAHDQTHPPQRSSSNLGTNDSAYGSHIGQSQSRFNETSGAGSGHNTPAPTTSAQQAGPSTQTSHVGHGQGLHNAGGYPYPQNPYYGGSYYSYVNQYPNQYGYNQQGYGAPYGGKGGMYGQAHHGYGVSPQASYEHSSSPAQPSGFGGSSTAGGRDSAFGSSLNDYSRSGSTQPSQATSQPSGFGASSESFGGRQGGFGGQNQSYGQTASAAEDTSSIKAFHDAKTGPSPSLGQPGRSGSAMNNTHSSSGQSQNNFPPPGNQGFGGYPNQFNSSYGSQHGGLGGLGGQSGGHQSGGYGSGGFGQYGSQYGSYNQRGWGGNYGH